MHTEEMIPANEFCTYHNIDVNFIAALNQSGLITITTVAEKIFVPASEMAKVERLIRLYELDINLEGIETISYLLQKMKDLQQQVVELNNRLNMYENK